MAQYLSYATLVCFYLVNWTFNLYYSFCDLAIFRTWKMSHAMHSQHTNQLDKPILFVSLFSLFWWANENSSLTFLFRVQLLIGSSCSLTSPSVTGCSFHKLHELETNISASTQAVYHMFLWGHVPDGTATQSTQLPFYFYLMFELVPCFHSAWGSHFSLGCNAPSKSSRERSMLNVLS